MQGLGVLFVNTHRLLVNITTCMKIIFYWLTSVVFKKCYNLWPVKFRIIMLNLSYMFRPQTDSKGGKCCVELVGPNSTIYPESRWAEVYQRQRHETPKNHADVFSLHRTRWRASVYCLTFSPLEDRREHKMDKFVITVVPRDVVYMRRSVLESRIAQDIGQVEPSGGM